MITYDNMKILFAIMLLILTAAAVFSTTEKIEDMGDN